MGEILGVRGFDLGVPDVAAASAFYTDVWNLSKALDLGSSTYLRASADARYVLGLHHSPEPRMLRFDLSARSEEAVDQIAQRLSAFPGLSQIEAPQYLDEPGGGYGFSFLDPDGRTTRILFKEVSGAQPPSVERPTRISHVLFTTAAKEAMLNLYVEGLQFRVVDHMHSSTFLNCGADHHSIGFSANPVGSTLHHAAFEMANIDAVMRGAGRLRHAGFNLDWGVGRHGPGDNVYAYFVGPHREIIEYSAEMVQVGADYGAHDSAWWETQHPAGWSDHWGISDPSTDFLAARNAIPFSAIDIFHADRDAAQ